MENNKHINLFALSSILAAMLVSSCSTDERYSIQSADDIDMEVNPFGGGFEIPIGQTEKFTMRDALSLAKDSGIDTLLKVAKDSSYSINFDGNYNLDDVIEDMDLKKLRDIDGAAFTQNVEYSLGDFDFDKFTIDGQKFAVDVPAFGSFSLDDIKIPAISSPDQKIKAGMHKYLPSDLCIGSKIPDMDYSANLIDVDEVKTAMEKVCPSETTEYNILPVLTMMGYDSFKLNEQSSTIAASFDLGANASQIADVKNVTLTSDSNLSIDLSIENCFLTDGSFIPDLQMDLSDLMVMHDADPQTGILDISSIVLSKDNGWKASKTFKITSLASGVPELKDNALKINGHMKFSGEVSVQSAKATVQKVKSLSGKKLVMKAVVSCGSMVLDAMDITLADGVGYNVDDVDMDLNVEYNLPKEIKSVSSVFLDQTKKLELNISATGLTNLVSSDTKSHISVYPDIVITFPEGVNVAEAVNNKVTISGKDLYEGPISEKFSVLSINPVCKDGKLTFNGKITAKMSAAALGTFSTKHLPKTEANDVTITASIKYQPAVADYDVELDKANITKTLNESKDFTIALEGLDDFGTFNITPKDNPVAYITLALPDLKETTIIGENLVLSIPKMVVVDGTGIQNFDPAKNTITINGAIPSRIELPIKYLRVTPEKDPQGKTVAKGAISFSGNISVDNTNITRVAMDALSGQKIDLNAVIPSMTVKSISLDGDIDKSLDYEFKDIVILDAQAMSSIPKEVKSIEEIELDGVKANILLNMSGIPVGPEFYLTNIKVVLPDFIYAPDGTHDMLLGDKVLIENNKAITLSAPIAKIKNVNLQGITELKGDIKFCASLYSLKPVVDVATLKNKITGSVRVSVGNGSSATDPGKIAISKAAVKVDYTIDQKETVSLGDIPSELQAPGVNFALNPSLYLNLKTNFGVPIFADFVITPYIDGVALTDKAVTIKNIEIPCSYDSGKTLENKYAIGTSAVAGPGVTAIRVDLSTLLERIPDAIELAIKAGVDQTKDCIIFPDAAYTCNMDYSFEVPVSFGNDFNFSYSSTIEVGTDINDILKMGKHAFIRGTYFTTLPLGVDCSIKFLDPNGREVALNTPLRLNLEPSVDGERVKTDDFNLELDFANREQINVKSLLISLTAKASGNVNVKSDQFIQLTNLKVGIPEGIVVKPE